MSVLTILGVAKKDSITPDKAQLKAIVYLEKIAKELTENLIPKANMQATKAVRKNSLFSFFTKKNTPKKVVESTNISKIQGLYLWGEVGRGKTWLMDSFYQTLPIKKIQRIHFHEFMLLVHKQLQNLPIQPDPLEIIGKNMSQEFRLICLDEFHVMDIADAVILHGLLKALFENNVVIVTTSNRHPDDLYKNGSHRERFLPAIELIKENMHVLLLDTDTDYRRGKEQSQDVFFTPHSDATRSKLEVSFNHYANSEDYSIQPIKIFGREIPVVRVMNQCIWFTFDTLCRGFRSSSDYLEIAKKYNVIILTNVPILHEGEEGPAKRFLNMIDSFYDQHTYLIMSSAVAIEEMYQGDLLQFEFERALSRLHQMRSQIWWQGFSNE